MTLNWYDLNEILCHLYTSEGVQEKHLEGDLKGNTFAEHNLKSTQNQIVKVRVLMDELSSQPTNQSDYELRIVSRMTNLVI